MEAYQRQISQQMLDERTQEVFDFIVTFKAEHDGLSPSIREIREHCHIASTSTVAYHLDKLEEVGMIEFYGDVGTTRNIMVTGGEWGRER